MTAGPGDEQADSLVVLAGTPTADELAAVTAVLTAMADEKALDGRRALPRSTQDAWQRSGRARRTDLYPGLGAWRRSFDRLS